MIDQDWRHVGGLPQEGECVKLEIKGGRVIYGEVVGTVTAGRVKGVVVEVGKDQQLFVPLREILTGWRYVAPAVAELTAAN